MSEETNNDLQNANISLEQILAAIIAKFGSVEISLEELLRDYSDKNIAVNQDTNTQNITFELAEMPETPAETE
jgi:hypothetical protein